MSTTYTDQRSQTKLYFKPSNRGISRRIIPSSQNATPHTIDPFHVNDIIIMPFAALRGMTSTADKALPTSSRRALITVCVGLGRRRRDFSAPGRYSSHMAVRTNVCGFLLIVVETTSFGRNVSGLIMHYRLWWNVLTNRR